MKPIGGIHRTRSARISRLRLLTAAIALYFLWTQPTHAQCIPSESRELTAEIAKLREKLQHEPHDPVVMYNLAADYAQRCDAANALELLQRLIKEPGALDPGAYRGFAFLHDSDRFQAIVAEVHRKNPPKIQSRPAFTVKEPDLLPEGMAYAPSSGRVYLGAAYKRKLIWTDRTGEIHDFVPSAADGLAFPLGLHVDEKRHHLWAVSSAFAEAKFDPPGITGLFEYDLATGKHLATYPLPKSAAGFLNDVTVSASAGTAYVTNTSNGAVYAANENEKDAELRQFLPPDSVPGANGIALSADEKILFVAGDYGIYRVDLTTRSVRPLQKPPAIIDASLDGMYFYRQSLVGIQNGIHPGRVVRFELDSTLTRIIRSQILETYNPSFENPTTGSLDGDSFLFMANPQLHRWTIGKPPPPASDLHDIQILRIALKP